jgi:hypothetical protein
MIMIMRRTGAVFAPRPGPTETGWPRPGAAIIAGGTRCSCSGGGPGEGSPPPLFLAATIEGPGPLPAQTTSNPPRRHLHEISSAFGRTTPVCAAGPSHPPSFAGDRVMPGQFYVSPWGVHPARPPAGMDGQSVMERWWARIGRILPRRGALAGGRERAAGGGAADPPAGRGEGSRHWRRGLGPDAAPGRRHAGKEGFDAWERDR